MRQAWSEDRIAQLIAEGRGQGAGANYKPWLTVRSLSSTGVSTRIWSPKTRRHHELLSNNEWHVFYAAEWDRAVVDIREQYPLNRQSTVAIAHRLGIKHPYYPGTHVAYVMTVDLLLTVRRCGIEEFLAIDVKPTEAASDARAVCKLEITREYFSGQGVRHVVIYHDRIPHIAIRNIRWIRTAAIAEFDTSPESHVPENLLEQMMRLIRARICSDRTLRMVCDEFDALYGEKPGTGLGVARKLMHGRQLIPDLNQPNLPQARLKSFRLAGANCRDADSEVA